MIRLTGSRRVTLIVALVVALTLIGGGGAVAYWSASAQLGASVATATTGMTQTVHPDAATTPLNVTYSAATDTAAGAVSVQNTGSREATYSIALGPEEASDLSGVISVAVAPVAAWEACTPATVLVNPTTGTLGATGFTASGEVAAGATTILCVQTSMSAGDVTAHADQIVELALGTQLAYADSAAWTVSAMTVSFTQSVGSSLLFFTDSSARYRMFNQDLCLVRYEQDLAADDGCYAWGDQWRITRDADGSFYISLAANQWSALTAPRWTAPAGNTTPVRTEAVSGSAAQRWQITPVAGAVVQIESVARPGMCVTAGARLWGGGPSDPRTIVLTPCAGSDAQKFSFETVGTPVPDPQTMTCLNQSSYLELSMPADPVYGQEITYRVFFATENAPTTRVAYPVGAMTGEWPRLQVYGDGIAGYIQRGGTPGNTWIHVEQRIADGLWHPVASAQIRVAAAGSGYQTACGWQ